MPSLKLDLVEIASWRMIGLSSTFRFSLRNLDFYVYSLRSRLNFIIHHLLLRFAFDDFYQLPSLDIL